MALSKFVENFYSFRATETVIDKLLQPSSPSQTVLAAIEGKLVEANNDYLARQYQDAIAAYQDAAGLIYSQIDPRFPVGVRTGWTLDPGLFDPMLSASLEWMNLIPARQPSTPVTPRVPVDFQKLAKVGQFDGAGVYSTQLATPAAAAALAGLNAAKTLQAAGNSAASAFFTQQATALSSVVVGAINPPTPAPTSPPTPAIPTKPTTIGTVSPVGTLSTVGTLSPVSTSAIFSGSPVISTAVLAAPNPITLPPAVDLTRTVGLSAGSQIVTFAWNPGDAPPLDQIKTSLYANRTKVTALVDLTRPAVQPSDIAAQLPHDFYYVIPLGLAECYHALGDYSNAEAKYLEAAGYQYLNLAIEAPYLVQRLLTLYQDWGDSLFRVDQAQAAVPIYNKALASNFTVPNSPLYTTPSLKPGADVARTVIGNLAKAGTLDVNPLIAAPLLEIQSQLLKINAGLDFWGDSLTSVPIWTFDYLQSVAINFTQLAISAERDFINFRDRADQATLTLQQLVQSVAQSQSEVQTAQLEAQAAAATTQVYQDGVTLAALRAKDATDNATEYASKSAQAIVHQALSAQLAGGDDGDASEINSLADTMMSGSYRLSGSRATLGAAEQLTALRLNRQYEVDALKRNAAELQTAQQQAQDELKAAQVRQAVANNTVTTAQLRASAAQQTLNSFDSQFFTPDVWNSMADQMRRLYRRYFHMALRSARLMQKAYNFETDQALKLIKPDYSTDEVKGLLGADALMADIQSFTYDLITSKLGKPQPLRQTISLAEKYGFQFEQQFRTTGAMDFETRIEDFDALYPGTFAGRVEAIEVFVDGIVPATGISGTLTNAGVSAYRAPSSGPVNPGSLKYRIQNKETLILSDYATRQDALLLPSDSRMLKVFEGAGVASSWHLELPRQVNDLDYGAITDVRITFYYNARYDPDLHDTVLAQLAALPNFNSRQRGMPLRWLYPDAFFKFQDTGRLAFTLRARDFPRNETKPMLDQVGVVIVTDGSVPVAGLKITLSTPGKAAATAQADAKGSIESPAGSSWQPLIGGTAIGDYVLQMTAANNPSLVSHGKLNLAPVVNIGLVLGYAFTPRT